MFRIEQRMAATNAMVGARLLGVPMFSSESPLSALLPADLILLRRQLLAPFLICFGHLVCHGPGPIFSVGPFTGIIADK